MVCISERLQYRIDDSTTNQKGCIYNTEMVTERQIIMTKYK